jgi:hypothetical protein
MTDATVNPVTVAWESLPERTRLVLELRLSGDTLDEVGSTIGVTRERVRQIQVNAGETLLSALDQALPRAASGTSMLDDQPAVPEDQLPPSLLTAPSLPMSVVLGMLGVVRPRTWAGDLPVWWTRRPGILDVRLRDLAAQAPFADDELPERAAEVGRHRGLPLHELLADERSPVKRGPAAGWVRHSREGVDAVYLWLKAQDEPRSSAEIAGAVAWGEHALRGAMRRDPRFGQRRPEGTWVLSEWVSAQRSAAMRTRSTW